MRFRKFLNRRKTWVGAIFALALILIGLLIWQNLKSKQIEAETQKGVEEGILWVEVPPDVSREDVIRLATRGEVGIRAREDQAILDKIEQAIDGRLSELPIPEERGVTEPRVGVRSLETGEVTLEEKPIIPEFTDLIIGLTKNGQPILPDLERTRVGTRAIESSSPQQPAPPAPPSIEAITGTRTTQEDQVATRSLGPVESFPCSGLTIYYVPIAFEIWSIEETRSLMNKVSSACSDLEAFQGPPFFSPRNYGLEFPEHLAYGSAHANITLNTIKIDLSKASKHEKESDAVYKARIFQTLIHELSHAFRDDLVVDRFNKEGRVFEEGLATAAEIYVSSKITDPSMDFRHFYLELNSDDYLNQSAVSGPLRYGSYDAGIKYLSSGSSFLRLYYADHNAIKKIHQEITVRQLNSGADFVALLHDNFRDLTVEGILFPDWFKSRKIWQEEADPGRYSAYDRVFNLAKNGWASPVNGRAKIEVFERNTRLSQISYLPEVEVANGRIPVNYDWVKKSFPIDSMQPAHLNLQVEIEGQRLPDKFPALLMNLDIPEEPRSVIQRFSSAPPNSISILGNIDVRYPGRYLREPAQNGAVWVFAGNEDQPLGGLLVGPPGAFEGTVPNLPLGPVQLKYMSPEGWTDEKLTTYLHDNGSLMVKMEVNAPDRIGIGPGGVRKGGARRTIDFELLRGWNQVTFPGLVPSGGQDVLLRLFNQGGYIWGFNANTKSYYLVTNVNQIRPGQAYWLYLGWFGREIWGERRIVSLPIQGPPALTQLSLVEGSNLVGFPQLENLVIGKMKVIDSNGQSYTLKEAADQGLIKAAYWQPSESRYQNLADLSAGYNVLPFHQGFWIKANSAGLKLILE